MPLAGPTGAARRGRVPTAPGPPGRRLQELKFLPYEEAIDDRLLRRDGRHKFRSRRPEVGDGGVDRAGSRAELVHRASEPPGVLRRPEREHDAAQPEGQPLESERDPESLEPRGGGGDHEDHERDRHPRQRVDDEGRFAPKSLEDRLAIAHVRGFAPDTCVPSRDLSTSGDLHETVRVIQSRGHPVVTPASGLAVDPGPTHWLAESAWVDEQGLVITLHHRPCGAGERRSARRGLETLDQLVKALARGRETWNPAAALNG